MYKVKGKKSLKNRLHLTKHKMNTFKAMFALNDSKGSLLENASGNFIVCTLCPVELNILQGDFVLQGCQPNSQIHTLQGWICYQCTSNGRLEDQVCCRARSSWIPADSRPHRSPLYVWCERRLLCGWIWWEEVHARQINTHIHTCMHAYIQ